MKDALRISILMLVILTLLTGLIYPLVVTGIAQVAMPSQANGSLVFHRGKAVGSSLVGQSFAGPGFFWGRPSATSPTPYNASSSSGSNLGPLNPLLKANVSARIEQLRKGDSSLKTVPVDLATASASGLDPHISPAAAEAQVHRVARARGMSDNRVREMVARFTEGRQLGLLGEPRVNVLMLNLALDQNTPDIVGGNFPLIEIPLPTHHAQTAFPDDLLRSHQTLPDLLGTSETAASAHEPRGSR